MQRLQTLRAHHTGTAAVQLAAADVHAVTHSILQDVPQLTGDDLADMVYALDAGVAHDAGIMAALPAEVPQWMCQEASAATGVPAADLAPLYDGSLQVPHGVLSAAGEGVVRALCAQPDTDACGLPGWVRFIRGDEGEPE